MKKALSVIAQVAMFCLGVGLFVGSLWLLVRFFAYGDNHPFNVLLGIFGVAPVMLNIADMDWLNSGLLEMFISIITACMIYASLANLALVVTQEASVLIAAGGLKNYRSLKRQQPAKPLTGFTGALLNILNPPK